MNTNVVGRPIVVGVDGSDSAHHAARWAADGAALRRLPLRLVTAVQAPIPTYTGKVVIDPYFMDQMRDEARQSLADTRERLASTHPGLDVDTTVLTGPHVPKLIEASRDAHLMVLGSRGLGGFTGALVGSTAVALAAHGHCPVTVVRGTPSDGPVVVGVDGSPASETAVALAFEEASVHGTDLIVVHTWLDYYDYATTREFVLDWDTAATGERELLAERLAGWQEKYPDVSVHRVVLRDRPVRALLEQATHARLLVVGSRGRGGFAGMLLGSTSEALIYHAPCPLLIARATC